MNKTAAKPPPSASAKAALPTSSSFTFRMNAASSAPTAASSRPGARATGAGAAKGGVGGRPGAGNDRRMMEQMEALQEQLEDHQSQLTNMRQQKGTLNNQLTETMEDLEACRLALANARREIREKEAAAEEARRERDAALDAERKKAKDAQERLQDELDSKDRECRKMKSKMTNLQEELDEYEITVDKQKNEIGKLENTVSKLRSDCGDSLGKMEGMEYELGRRQKRIDECESEIERLVKKGDWHEKERRRLHNEILELKGNIRVFCRMRPFLKSELKSGELTSDHISFDEADETKIVVNDTNSNTPAVPFKFDLVFKQDATQALIFEELSQLVQSALDGYSVCVFAYGQTGSGKTYTMEGPDDYNDESMGMIPRSVKQIFDTAEKMRTQGWSFEFKASMLEIYNETINDLLYEGKADKAPKHEIKLLKEGSKEVYVTNLIVKGVSEPRDVRALMDIAHKNRKSAATKCNERSSRSHFVCNIKIHSHNSRTNEDLYGSLDLVDLAGSERIKDSGATGATAKEAFKINGSLKVLGDVIEAIKKNQNHVPFRDSLLTKLLQNNLVGSSKTLMFVNISPRPEHANETVNSLRFATKANNTNIGTASQKTKS